MTARWVVDEIKPARQLNIIWQPISLLLKNQPDPDSRFYEPTKRTYRLLRVMEAVRASEGEAAVFDLYWEYGRRIHHDQELDFNLTEALDNIGLNPTHASAYHSETYDAEIEKRHQAGLELCGDDVGTPIIAFNNRRGEKQGYFGPVITRVPPTEDSLAMWDALVTMMDVDGFWELKRTRTEHPEFGNRP
ncbi:MAG: hypothetical protein KTU85_01495 [Acidimicrobiia bacterium]|nr:hypothetical protein [Acidimicrobiia bacterium]MCY4456447.1 hypothetical protein [Acidimicrobiaceae bacterium]